MGLEKVIQNIKAEGKRAADAEIARAKEEAAAIVADAEQQASELKARRTAEANSAAEALKRRDVASAELEAKKIRLNAEKETLQDVREAVLAEIAKIPQDERIQHIQTLAKRATIPDGSLLVAPQDEAAAREAGLKVAGTTNALGGVVVVSPDGQLREDLTYEAIFSEVWGESIRDVAQMLFRKGD